MADLNEQMTSLLEKEELPYADDASAATDYITKPYAKDTRKYALSPSKPFNPIESQALLEAYKPEIKEARQEDRFEKNVDTAKSIGTGLLTGFAGLPSDVLEGVNFVNDYLAERDIISCRCFCSNSKRWYKGNSRCYKVIWLLKRQNDIAN